MKIIEELQKFGLTKIEAQVYYELLKNPDSNGSQISKKIDTPRTSVYMALEKLYSLGFIYLIPSLNERKNYMAADPDKLVMKLKSEYMRSAEFLENELLKIHIRSDNEQFINLRGEENILDKIKGLPAKIGQKNLVCIAGKGRDKVGLARLAGPKNAHAHLAAGGLLALVKKTGRMAQIFLQGCALTAHKFGIVLKPRPCGTRVLRQFAATPR